MNALIIDWLNFEGEEKDQQQYLTFGKQQQLRYSFDDNIFKECCAVSYRSFFIRILQSDDEERVS